MKYETKDTEILKLMASGLRAKEIGQKLNISNRVVERRVEIMKFSHGAKNAIELVVMAIRKKIIE